MTRCQTAADEMWWDWLTDNTRTRQVTLGCSPSVRKPFPNPSSGGWLWLVLRLDWRGYNGGAKKFMFPFDRFRQPTYDQQQTPFSSDKNPPVWIQLKGYSSEPHESLKTTDQNNTISKIGHSSHVTHHSLFLNENGIWKGCWDWIFGHELLVLIALLWNNVEKVTDFYESWSNKKNLGKKCNLPFWFDWRRVFSFFVGFCLFTLVCLLTLFLSIYKINILWLIWQK